MDNNDMGPWRRRLTDTCPRLIQTCWFLQLTASRHHLEIVYRVVCNVTGSDEDNDEEVVAVDGGRLLTDEDVGVRAAAGIRGSGRGGAVGARRCVRELDNRVNV
ncbi:hypothetical protein J6590_068786 [Homalodisca vitripennis]|nr:hypothetical protein J6590_068786 [Homalodisca vitripennis]